MPPIIGATTRAAGIAAIMFAAATARARSTGSPVSHRLALPSPSTRRPRATTETATGPADSRVRAISVAPSKTVIPAAAATMAKAVRGAAKPRATASPQASAASASVPHRMRTTVSTWAEPRASS